MPRFDKKTWNDAVFQKYLKKIPNLREHSLLQNGVLEENNSLKSRLVDGVGGNRLIEPIKGAAKGKFVNYDGKTTIPTASRDTFTQVKIVKGIAGGYEEKDFSTDISGEDYMPVASEVAEDLADLNMDTLLAILKGIFLMAPDGKVDFAKQHTYEENGVINATSINNAGQKAFGDKKNKMVSMAFMHSNVANTLENLQILEYLKYTDANGVQSNMSIAQQGNKVIIIDDDMPMEHGYYLATADTPNALKVKASGAGVGEINQATVKGADFYPAKITPETTYVVEGDRYTTYLLGKGAIEYCNVGAKVPSEVDRDAAKDGGIDKLYVRERKLYAPKYISFKGPNSIISPTDEELATGTNWELVNNGEEEKVYVDPKLVPIARLYTRG